jgi:hypothetical protein
VARVLDGVERHLEEGRPDPRAPDAEPANGRALPPGRRCAALATFRWRSARRAWRRIFPRASFAGQHESFVGVRRVNEPPPSSDAPDPAPVSGWRLAAMKRVTGGGAVAVLIQRLVDGNASGVAFTANPVYR